MLVGLQHTRLCADRCSSSNALCPAPTPPPLPGFHHSAFTFAHESHMASVQIQPNLVPPAALVTFVQKGLQYMEAEANLEPVRAPYVCGAARSVSSLAPPCV